LKWFLLGDKLIRDSPNHTPAIGTVLQGKKQANTFPRDVKLRILRCSHSAVVAIEEFDRTVEDKEGV
jgi:hypothetical protein